MTKTRFSRREILRYSGAASLLLVPVLRPRLAHAQEKPVRLVTFYYGNGPTAEIGRMFPARSGDNWTWGNNLLTRALQPHAQYMSIARGLWIRDGRRPKGAHGGAAISWATGSNGLVHPDVDDHASENASIDHWYAEQTGTQKLYLGVERGNRRVFSSSYAGYDQPSQPEQDMRRAYDSVFRGFMPAGDAEQAQRRANRRLFVLDTLVQDLKAAQRIYGLSQQERERLQRYEASLDAIETQLRNPQGSRLTIGSPPDVSFGGSIPERTRAALDILVGAMALDLRNACAFQIGAAYHNTNYSFIPGAPFSHHSAQHDGGGDPTLATVWIHEQAAYLLAQMREIDEGDGTNLLDNAAVLVGCDTPHGNNHNYNMDHPTFLFGKARGRLRGNVDAPSPGGHRDHVDILATTAEALPVAGSNFFAQRARFGGMIEGFLV